MYSFALNALALVSLVAAPPDQISRASVAQASESSDLMSALRTSDVAEIYIVSRSLEFPMRLGPESVRSSGCKYSAHRGSPEWPDLEHRLAVANIRFAPTSVEGEVRVGLVLGDRRGTIREIYANDLPLPNGRVAGFTQRQSVEISARFVTALRDFVERHPELALPAEGPTSRCPRRDRPLQ
jgi:hypothetical protein